MNSETTASLLTTPVFDDQDPIESCFIAMRLGEFEWYAPDFDVKGMTGRILAR